jgi:hypothetical protein
MNMCELTLAVSHPPQEKNGWFKRSPQRGVRLDLGGISQLTLWRQGWTLVRFMFIFYFVRLPLCNKYFDGERELGLHLFSLLILVVQLPNTNNWTN